MFLSKGKDPWITNSKHDCRYFLYSLNGSDDIYDPMLTFLQKYCDYNQLLMRSVSTLTDVSSLSLLFFYFWFVVVSVCCVDYRALSNGWRGRSRHQGLYQIGRAKKRERERLGCSGCNMHHIKISCFLVLFLHQSSGLHTPSHNSLVFFGVCLFVLIPVPPSSYSSGRFLTTSFH